MKIYDETTKQEIVNPDLSNGYLYEGTIVTGHEEETIKIMPGTISEKYPMGFRQVVPAHDVLENCMYYHAYTDEDIEREFSKKNEELRKSKDSVIQNGAEVTLSDGTQKHFFYDIASQADIGTMFNAVMLGMDSYIYHSEDGGCDIYSKEDILNIHATLSSLKTKEETYYGQLISYVKSLTKVPEIQKVKYGDELTGIYLEEYNRLLAYAMTQMQKLIERLKTDAS